MLGTVEQHDGSNVGRYVSFLMMESMLELGLLCFCLSLIGSSTVQGQGQAKTMDKQVEGKFHPILCTIQLSDNCTVPTSIRVGQVLQ